MTALTSWDQTEIIYMMSFSTSWRKRCKLTLEKFYKEFSIRIWFQCFILNSEVVLEKTCVKSL